MLSMDWNELSSDFKHELLKWQTIRFRENASFQTNKLGCQQRMNEQTNERMKGKKHTIFVPAFVILYIIHQLIAFSNWHGAIVKLKTNAKIGFLADIRRYSFILSLPLSYFICCTDELIYNSERKNFCENWKRAESVFFPN